jgi:hypothetical protein
MRGLYRATAMLVLDETLRKAVSESAAVVNRPDLLDPILIKQPDLVAIKKIDHLFRERGLFLPLYDLCEINRWFMEDKNDPPNLGKFSAVLKAFGEAVKDATSTGAAVENTGFLEALGASIVDPLLRSTFTTGNVNLSDLGFAISLDEEQALRITLTPGSVADTMANKILHMGWGSIDCTSRFLPYPGFIHSNK